MHSTAAESSCLGDAGPGRWPEALYVWGQYAESSSRTAVQHRALRTDSLRNLSRRLAIRKKVYADLKKKNCSLFSP